VEKSSVKKTSTEQGLWSKLKIGPNAFRHFMNCWPPLIAMRIHIERIAPDWREIDVRMKLSLRNKNYVGTHFGGGLFAMVDPFYMLMLSRVLGKSYVVWDKSATIDFVAPGKSTVYAQFRITQAQLEEMLCATADGKKFEPTYEIFIQTVSGETIAKVAKTLYIRKKKSVG
jgi:acyl-coenzyme A thioesterase PaaI-like protein